MAANVVFLALLPTGADGENTFIAASSLMALAGMSKSNNAHVFGGSNVLATLSVADGEAGALQSIMINHALQ